MRGLLADLICRYVLFDFGHVLDCDFSATATFREVVSLFEANDIETVASGMNDKV